MKKTLVSMVTGALVIGAASTTFAAANPFSDVPANSWAYDAVAKLAADGVVNGFPDGTFRGNENMTRYQMAQIVAKAMTYENLTKADKALVDKLAAEFSNELDNLGVRVSNLEKKSDNVKWTGYMKYTYSQKKMPTYKLGENGKAGKYQAGDNITVDNKYTFALTPTAFLGNSGWTAHARIRYFNNANSAANSDNGSTTTVDRIYVEGPLFGSQATLGKFESYSDTTLGSGMIMDDNISGAQFVREAGNVKVTTTIGKYQYSPNQNGDGGASQNAFDGSGTYAAIELGYAPKDSKLSAVAGYYSLRNIHNNITTIGDLWDATSDAGPSNAVFTNKQPNTTPGTVTDAALSEIVGYSGGAIKYQNNQLQDNSGKVLLDVNSSTSISDINKVLRANKDAIINGYNTAINSSNAETKAKAQDLTNLVGSNFYGNDSDKTDNNIWSLGLGYKFSDNLKLYGIYAKSNLDAPSTYKGGDQSKAYDFTLSYKGVNQEQAGSWGAYVGYRYLGAFATIAPSYDGAQRGTKGIEIGTQYAIAQNIVASLLYFDGKTLATDFGNNDSDYKKVYGSVQFYF